MSKGKIIMACLNGGMSFGLLKQRTYLSTVMRRAIVATRRSRSGASVTYRHAKGFVFPTPSALYRRGPKGVINFAREHARSDNALILLGKSAGAHNWITHLNEYPEVFQAYRYVGAIFVDTNIGPRASNHNGEILKLDAELENVAAFYTTDPNWGGYKIETINEAGGNYELPGRTHFDCCKSELLQRTVEAYIDHAGSELI